MKKMLRNLYDSSPRKIVGFFKGSSGEVKVRDSNGNRARRSFKPVSKEFILSEEYEELMQRFIPFGSTYDKHEAQNLTRNFKFRHHEVQDRLGIFRWRGIYEHRSFLLDIVTNPELEVIDLGGAACPLGFNSTIVDFLEADAWGRTVNYKFLNDLGKQVDVIFTSHTLEHVEPLEDVLDQVYGTLKNGGKLIAHVPSFHCERWRAGNHTNKLYNDHVWTFGISGTKVPDGLVNYLEIDSLISNHHFNVISAEYCGDDSIFVVAEKAVQ
jgi:SAM-dependent methyltransferase